METVTEKRIFTAQEVKSVLQTYQVLAEQLYGEKTLILPFHKLAREAQEKIIEYLAIAFKHSYSKEDLERIVRSAFVKKEYSQTI